MCPRKTKPAGLDIEADLLESVREDSATSPRRLNAQESPEALRERIKRLEVQLKEQQQELEAYRQRESELLGEPIAPAESVFDHDFEMSETIPEKRSYSRYVVDWRVAIVNENDEERHIFHARANDISMGGVSLLCDENVFFTQSVILLIAVPPFTYGGKEKIIEIRCRTLYTVLAASVRQFRLGFHFLEFRGDSKSVLESYFAHHVSYG
ncbi:MAG: PilZ domain-containing protein [Sulfuricellaceae bacterium]|nr:PilZ domain-containing protein [Sulfuricellaceae bacterium]